jgi:hypothetical protein
MLKHTPSRSTTSNVLLPVQFFASHRTAAVVTELSVIPFLVSRKLLNDYIMLQPTLIQGSKVLSTGGAYTIGGPLISAIAYLQTGAHLYLLLTRKG